MTKKKVFLIVQAALCAALAVLCAAAAIRIYREGMALRASGDALAWIYTREKVAARFGPIAPVFFASLLMTVAGLALGVRDARSERPARDDEWTRNAVASRMRTPSAPMRRERDRQRIIRRGGRIACAACALPALLYVVRPAHFPEDATEAMLSALLRHTLPWIAAGIGCLAVAGTLLDRSFRRETEAARAQLASERNEAVAKPVAEPRADSRGAAMVRAILLAAAVAMIVAGACNGSLRDVLVKAVNLCTECVGLG